MLEWDVESGVDQILQLRPMFAARQMDGILSLPRQFAESAVYEFYANVSSRTLAQFDAQQDRWSITSTVRGVEVVISDALLAAAGFGRIATDTDVSIGQHEVDPWTWWGKVSAAMRLGLFLMFKGKDGPDQIWCPIYGPPRTRVLL